MGAVEKDVCRRFVENEGLAPHVNMEIDHLRSVDYKTTASCRLRDIRRATRRHYSAEEKTCTVPEGLRGEDDIAELCRREGFSSNVYYRWSEKFLGAGLYVVLVRDELHRYLVACFSNKMVPYSYLGSD